jgi:hypothetical protein
MFDPHDVIHEIKGKKDCPHGIYPKSSCYICEEEKKQKKEQKNEEE